jgi:hypothetical protein
VKAQKRFFRLHKKAILPLERYDAEYRGVIRNISAKKKVLERNPFQHFWSQLPPTFS